ncbi:MAG: Nramp family divalent metal transporter, partial [Planctomycetota bacterium]|nr:Nramp family divalent metal transporter [Planctomycetota bacterium]
MSDPNKEQTPQDDEASTNTVDSVNAPNSEIQEPPTSFGGILRKLGPGLIIAASIVGSGELIATTKTGAQAGISLLWLIVVGCVIKVFVQIELGRVAISQGETTLTSLNRIPGPRLVVSWIIWYWLIMMIVGFGQLGGIIGGVGQAMALARPLT